MNKTGLFIALGVAVLAGLVFGFYPQLDLALARSFYDSGSRQFMLRPEGVAQLVRRSAMWITWAFAVPAIIAAIAKLIWPRKPLLVRGRTVVFLLSTILLTAIFLPSVVFKDHWGRPRPVATSDFNGAQTFRPWWDPRGTNSHNGSFFSGEAATAFWTYAPAALAPPALRPFAFAGATLFGLTTGLLRMAFGAHYASDIIAAGVVAFLVTWLMHGLFFRWQSARFSDERIEQCLGDAGMKLRSSNSFTWLVTVVACLTAFRLITLKFSVVDLFPDEARYWAWSQVPAFGYFSKPPFIAWIIAAAGRLCGDSELCVRAAAPMFYAGTALTCYGIARHLYGEVSAFWTGLSIALATGVVYSARIVSTDVPLLFFWALALLAYVKLLERATWQWSVVLGLALGFGLLSKYAMIYFLLGMLGTTFLVPAARHLWRDPRLGMALAIALVLLTPNLVWNATHHFATFRHTGHNISGGGLHLNLFGPFAFLASQFGVCGPIVFLVFLFALFRQPRLPFAPGDRIMLAFAAPALLLVTLLSLFTSVEANWAATSAIAITILAVVILVRRNGFGWLRASVALGLALQIALGVGDALADRISLPGLAKPDIYHRTMGWKTLSAVVRQAAQANGVRSIAAENSDVVATLAYYLRHDPWPVLSGAKPAIAANQFDLDRPLNPASPEPVLYVCDRTVPERLSYSEIETLPPIEAVTGPHSARRFAVFKLSGARGEAAPINPSSR